MFQVTNISSLAVDIPAQATGSRRTFAVMTRGLFVRRYVTAGGYGTKSVGSLEMTSLGKGLYAQYQLVSDPKEASEFLTFDEACMLHRELRRPGFAVVVCVDYVGE